MELIEDWILCDGMKIKEIISSSEYTKLDKKLQDQYADLLKNQVSNNVEIYYHDKLLRHHSIGQRASALILFILMQSDNDIILIDQPEDDLDNKIIYDEVITAIAKRNKIYNLFLLHTMLTFQFWVMLKEFLWLSIKIQRLIYRKGILT